MTILTMLSVYQLYQDVDRVRFGWDYSMSLIKWQVNWLLTQDNYDKIKLGHLT